MGLMEETSSGIKTSSPDIPVCILQPGQENTREIEVKMSTGVEKHLGRRHGSLHDAVGKNILDGRTHSLGRKAQLCMTLDKLPSLSERLALNIQTRTKDHSRLAHRTEQVGGWRGQGCGRWQ